MSNLAANRSAIKLLAALFLFSATGFHHWASHVPYSGVADPAKPTNGISLATRDAVNNPEEEHCNACFLSRLLNQCLFPFIGRTLVLEYSILYEQLSSSFMSGPAFSREVNRAPPAAACLLIN